METMSRGGAGLPTSLSGGGLAHVSAEVSRGQSTSFTCLEAFFFCSSWFILAVAAAECQSVLTAAVFVRLIQVQREISGEETFGTFPSSAERRQPDGETQPEKVTLTSARVFVS